MSIKCSLHSVPIFRLLLKVAVNGSKCDCTIFADLVILRSQDHLEVRRWVHEKRAWQQQAWSCGCVVAVKVG